MGPAISRYLMWDATCPPRRLLYGPTLFSTDHSIAFHDIATPSANVHGTRETPNPNSLMNDLLSSFPWWHSIATTRPQEWTVPIFPVFRDLKCLDSIVLENPDFPSADIPMAPPLVGISSPVHEDLTPSQLLQIRRLSGIYPRSNELDPFSFCAHSRD
jgi:hypothetical protein